MVSLKDDGQEAEDVSLGTSVLVPPICRPVKLKYLKWLPLTT